MSKTICIGAGPAGLTAAYELATHGHDVLVLEADSHYVGGISRTIERDGFCFDIGGHRFFSKSGEVEALWQEILGDDFLTRSRKSRIFYDGKFYPYPLDLWRTLANLGVVESVRCGLSYVWAHIFPTRNPLTFEQWVTNQFGARLFTIFFKTYTEKVWGMSCSDISADWAAQRIKGLSLPVALLHALAKSMGLNKKSGRVKTLIESFRYPRKGPGMMWEAATRKIREHCGHVQLASPVRALSYDAASQHWHVTYEDVCTQARHEVVAKQVISSMPLAELVQAIAGSPEHVRQAASALRYRDFLLVALILKKGEKGFDDNWLYIHDPNVQVGRIQNFKSWSPDMVPQGEERLCYGMEYFCYEGDGLWESSDDTLIAQATQELVKLGLANADDVQGGYVVRQPKAYPVYDQHYQEHVVVVRTWLAEACPGLQVAGRNGMHKYNNQDHSMMTALLAARNILAGELRYDVWQVNQDAQYHEEGQSGATGERLVPRALKEKH